MRPASSDFDFAQNRDAAEVLTTTRRALMHSPLPRRTEGDDPKRAAFVNRLVRGHNIFGGALRPNHKLRSNHSISSAAENHFQASENEFTLSKKSTILLGAPGLLATVACASYRRLDSSVGKSGPHAFAVRFSATRQRHVCVHNSPPHVSCRS